MATSTRTRTLPLESWSVGHHRAVDEVPPTWIPARVPGAVQLDWARAEGLEDWWVNENFRQYGWTESVFWTYRHLLPCTTLGPGERLVLVAEGVDYGFEIRLDGRTLHAQEGMFRPAIVDLTDVPRDPNSVLEVVVFPPPMHAIREGEEGRRQADRTCKPPVSYGWDFHPRLIPSGIWRPIRLEVRPPDRLSDIELHYEISLDLLRADLTFEFEVVLSQPAIVHWELAEPRGAVVHTGSVLLQRSGTHRTKAFLESPLLWWPNDMGAPDRYSLAVRLVGVDGEGLDEHLSRVGFRRTRLVMAEGQWSYPGGIPATQVPPPITLEINGKPIFVRGGCMTPADVFYGTIDAERYASLVDLAVGLNWNLLRIWGGGIVPPKEFFDLCDERGLLVWQEFPLSCNAYEATPEYLGVLEPEARAIVRRVRRHPCLALWCGGNELFNYWSRSTMQNRALRLLDSICLELDPHVPYLPTVPLMGIGHGWYAFRHIVTGKDILEYFQEGGYTAYTEFGCAGASPVEVLRSFLPEDDLFPPDPATAWRSHHGLQAFCEDGIGWLCLPYIEDYFGPCRSIEEVVAGSEWLQCTGYQCAYEEARRQKPHCAMAVNWCFNEPWPTAANCSLVNWPARPKPSYASVREACRPQMLSARLPRFDHHRHDSLSVEVWLLNDRYDSIEPLEAQVRVVSGGREIGASSVALEGAPPNRHTLGPRLSFPLGEADPGELFVLVQCPQRPELNSQYRLLVRP